MLAPVAAAAVPTPVAATSYAVAVDDSVATEDSEEANATGPPWQHNRLTLATLGSGRFD